MSLNYVSRLENHSDKISVIYQTEENMLKENDIWWSKRAWSKAAFYLYVFDELRAIFLTIWVADQTHKASGLMMFNQMINTMQHNCPFLSVNQFLLSLIKKIIHFRNSFRGKENFGEIFMVEGMVKFPYTCLKVCS